jgi:hypothetical protein
MNPKGIPLGESDPQADIRLIADRNVYLPLSITSGRQVRLRLRSIFGETGLPAVEQHVRRDRSACD